MNSYIIRSDLPTHPVFEFKLTPIPFLMELFIDSTGDVVMASDDMEMLFQTYNTRYVSFLIMEHSFFFNCFDTVIA